jgi:CheY-like chemotaxis protein
MKQNQQTILYAEDEATDAFLFQRALIRAGVRHHLEVMSDGRAAIDYLNDAVRTDGTGNELPALVLLDIHMPGISGFEVLDWIRATPGVSSLITLMLSSSHHPYDVQRAYALGANGYLVKPCCMDESVVLVKALKDYWLTHNQVPINYGVGSMFSDKAEASSLLHGYR